MVLKNPKFQFNYRNKDKKSTLWYPNLLNTLNILSHPPPPLPLSNNTVPVHLDIPCNIIDQGRQYSTLSTDPFLQK